MKRTQINIPPIFKPLFLPNYTAEERNKFTANYKAELKRRLLHGEELTDAEIGVKTIVMDSGRVSGKSLNGEYGATPDFFGERGDIWYCRSEENTIRRSIFQSMQSTLHRQGYTLSNNSHTMFKVSTSPFEIKCNLTGNVMQFFAINKDINRTKAMTPPSGRLKRVILEEANEPDDSIYVDALRSTAIRYMDEMSKFVYQYNPPPSLNAWANKYYPQKVKQGALRIHSSWEDIVDYLDPVVIADILTMKQEDPVHYAYWYGGEIVSLEGLVIWSFDRNKHVITVGQLQRRFMNNIFYQPSAMFYGVDSGLKKDATAISGWGLFPDGKLIKLGTFYLNIAEERRKTGLKGISHTDQVELMVNWHNEFKLNMKNIGITIPPINRERWCFDGAGLTQDLMFEFEKATRYLTTAITDKDIERDIARLVSSYRSGQLEILDTPDNQISIEELTTFSRNEDNEIPEGQSDHTIDADKYATYDYYNNF